MAAQILSSKSLWSLILEKLIDVKLQNWRLWSEISKHGFEHQFLSLVQKNPGSPDPDSFTNFQISENSSSVVSCLKNTTELFALALWGSK